MKLLSLTFCLACLMLGASTFASYASLPEESLSPVATVSSETSVGDKSLADFGNVLGQRLAGVWQEVRGLVGGTVAGHSLLSSSSPSSSPSPSSSQAIDERVLFSSGVSVPDYFSDTVNDPHASYINLLAKEGIVAGQNGKFYPDNYLRLYDLTKMLVDLYRIKVGYGLSSDQGLLPNGAFPNDNSLPSRYVATALDLGFLSNVQPLDFQKFVTSQDITQMLVNIGYQRSGMVRIFSLDRADAVTRGEVAEYLVMAFDITSEGITPYQAGTTFVQVTFSDIYAHPYQPAISTLAELGIISTDAPKFYPDNYLHRYDFTIMLVNAVLHSRHQTLNARYLSGYPSPFVDVPASSYSPFVYFAYDQGIVDYLIINKRGQNYFLPDSLMTRHEVYTVLAKASGKDFTYDINQADQSSMTRGEFAQILVDLYALTPPEIVQTTEVAEVGSGSLLDKLSALLQIKELLAKI